ncbi:uncharacterized protein [Saccopteryx bilineata]|uniref:uncharacterized protein n=1 Tax=Saccopteryx bilineata TaxID=59482 RepID=UPI00338DA51D
MEWTPSNNEDSEDPKENDESTLRRGEFGTEFAQFLQILEECKRQLAKQSAQEKKKFEKKIEEFNRKLVNQSAQEKTQVLQIMEDFKRELAEQSAQEKEKFEKKIAESEQETDESKLRRGLVKERIDKIEKNKAESEPKLELLKKTFERTRKSFAEKQKNNAKNEMNKEIFEENKDIVSSLGMRGSFLPFPFHLRVNPRKVSALSLSLVILSSDP